MFEVLLSQSSSPLRLTQPVLAFALHAGLLVLIVGQRGEPPSVVVDPVQIPPVIYIPDGPRQPAQVPPRPEIPVRTDIPVPAPACVCPMVLPEWDPVALPEPQPRLDGRPVLPIPGSISGDSAARRDGEPYRPEEISEPPAMIRLLAPVYPPALKAAGIDGAVSVEYVVGADGRVEPGTIAIVSSDHPLMAEAVEVVVRAARFHPGKVRGVAVRTLVRQTFRFSLMPL